MKQVFNCYYTLPVLGKGELLHLIATFVQPFLSRITTVSPITYYPFPIPHYPSPQVSRLNLVAVE